jgi:DHA3 family tetracycline resistance protein-like MFS transporter
VRLLQPFRRRDFAVLWLGQATSMVGDGIFVVAIAFQVLELHNSAGALSGVLLAGSLGLVACLLAGGVVTDRVERRRVLIFADLVRLVAVGAMGVLSVAGALQIWHVVALMLLYGGGEAFFQPAFGALLPAVVPSEELVQANAVHGVVRPLTLRFAGPALGGALVSAAGPGQALLADAATFGVSAACVFALRARSRAGATPEGALRELAAGWRYVRSQPWLYATLASAALAVLFIVGPYEVLLPYLIRNELGGDAGTFGAVLAISGIGAVVAAAAVGQLGLGSRPVTLMFASWTISALPLCGYAAATASWQLMPLAAVAGAGVAVASVIWSTLMQTRVPPALLGRVSSLDWLVSLGLTPVSFALTAPAAAVLGASATLVVAGVVAALGTVAFWPLALRQAPSAARSAVKPG